MTQTGVRTCGVRKQKRRAEPRRGPATPQNRLSSTLQISNTVPLSLLSIMRGFPESCSGPEPDETEVCIFWDVDRPTVSVRDTGPSEVQRGGEWDRGPPTPLPRLELGSALLQAKWLALAGWQSNGRQPETLQGRRPTSAVRARCWKGSGGGWAGNVPATVRVGSWIK